MEKTERQRDVRRVISLFLCVFLLAGTLGLTVSAADGAGEDYTEHWITIDRDVMYGSSYLTADRDMAYPGETVTVTAHPADYAATASITAKMSSDDLPWNEDYAFDVPGISHPDRDTITFTMPSANVYLTAAFIEDYDQVRVFVGDMEGGTVTADRYITDAYSTVYLTVHPANGYRYVEDSLTVTEPDNPEADRTDAYLSPYPEEDGSYRLDLYRYSVDVTAAFEALPAGETYPVTLPGSVENGSLTADLTEAAEGWTVTLTARPEARSNYLLEELTVTARSGAAVPVRALSAAGGTYAFTMPGEPVSVSAVFSIPQNPVTVVSEDPSGLGSQIIQTFDEPVPYGDTVFVSLLVRDGGKLVSLTAVGESGTEYEVSQRDRFYTFTMPAEPVTLTGVFSSVDYTITADETMRGRLTVSTGGEPVPLPAAVHMGETLTVTDTLTAADNAVVTSFRFSFYDYSSTLRTVTRAAVQDGMTFRGSLELNWPSDVVVSAVYKPAAAVIVVDSEHGGITADKGLAAAGDTVTLTAAPDPDWALTELAVVSGAVPVPFTDNGDGTFTFTMPEGVVTVTGVFTSAIVPYVNETGTAGSARVTYVNNVTTRWSGEDEWYAVRGNVTVDERVMVSGDVNLILCDGAALTAKLGIGVPEGSSLTVWAQEKGDGKLIADVYSNAKVFFCPDAAIGGTGENGVAGAITFWGGNITANGGFFGAAIGGAYKAGFTSVSVHGGTLTLNDVPTDGGTGTGIGCGSQGSGGSVTITGGAVTAYARANGDAGVGGANTTIEISGGTVIGYCMFGSQSGIGGDGATVTITGGTVSGKAEQTYGSVGIGGGSATVTITGGNVRADGDTGGVGLGGENAVVTITGGTVTAVDSQYWGGVASLGGKNCRTYLGWDEDRPLTTLNVHQFGGSVYLLRDFITQGNEEVVYKTTGESAPYADVTRLQDKTLVPLPAASVRGAVSYVNETGTTDTVGAVFVKNITTTWSGEDVWYAVRGNVTVDERVMVSGDVNLILCDGAALTAKLGIGVPEGSSLTVWAQEKGDGKLIADVYSNTTVLFCPDAAIGGTGKNGVAGPITIWGGNITANGGFYGAAIGGADGAGFTSVTVHGGTLTLNDVNSDGGTGTGIGCGSKGSGGSITITGGRVTAYARANGGAGIGGEYTDVTITGGTVDTYAVFADQSGIGGNGATVTITGGTVSGKANRTYGSVGIGGECADIIIAGGNIRADGDTGGVGLGGEGAVVTITGGTVTAVDSEYWGGVASLGGKNCRTYLDWDVSRPLTTLNVHKFGGEVYLLRDFREENRDEPIFTATGEYTAWSDVTQLQDKTLVPARVGTTCPDCGADLSGIRYCRGCLRCENCTTICRDCGLRCILCDPGFYADTGRCSVCGSLPLGPDDPGTVTPDQPGSIVIDNPTVAIAEDGRSAQVGGDSEGLYVRIALVIEFRGESGLYITQGAIADDGVIELPKFQVPGLTVTGVDVALVLNIDDIMSPIPIAVAVASKTF